MLFRHAILAGDGARGVALFRAAGLDGADVPVVLVVVVASERPVSLSCSRAGIGEPDLGSSRGIGLGRGQRRSHRRGMRRWWHGGTTLNVPRCHKV